VKRQSSLEDASCQMEYLFDVVHPGREALSQCSVDDSLQSIESLHHHEHYSLTESNYRGDLYTSRNET